MIKKTMCIGCSCEGFIFSSVFGTRILGPVDNFHGWNFKSTLDVFNGKLFDAILLDKIDKKEENINKAENDDDNKFRYYCTKPNGQLNWRTVHNNFEREDRKQLLRKRIDDFNKFGNEINEECSYIYTISDGDEYLNDNDFQYVLDNLPTKVVEHLIIICGGRYKLPDFFNKNFKCILYNIDFNYKDDKLLQIINKWFKCM